MELGEYYDEIVKEAGLIKEDKSEETKEAEFNGVDRELVEGAFEVLKTAGLIEDEKEEVSEDEPSEEKIAAVKAICDQFEADKIEFDDEDEKIASAVAILEGFEAEVAEEAEKEASVLKAIKNYGNKAAKK